MDNMKNINKMWINSLSFLDNSVINSIIVIILVLYSSTIFDNINSFIGNIYSYSIVRIIILLLTVYWFTFLLTIKFLLGTQEFYYATLLPSFLLPNTNISICFILLISRYPSCRFNSHNQ